MAMIDSPTLPASGVVKQAGKQSRPHGRPPRTRKDPVRRLRSGGKRKTLPKPDSTRLSSEENPKFSKAPSTPGHAASVGRPIDVGTKRVGSSKVWETEGPARNIYESGIRSILESILGKSGIAEGVPLLLKQYMVGPTRDQAFLTVLICCANKEIREACARHLLESQILQNYGFMLGTSTLPLEMDTTDRSQVHAPSSAQHKGLKVPTTRNNPLWVGRRISIEGYENVTATGGALVSIGDSVFQITVAHFQDSKGTAGLFSDADLDDVQLYDANDFGHITSAKSQKNSDASSGGTVSPGMDFTSEVSNASFPNYSSSHRHEEPDFKLESPRCDVKSDVSPNSERQRSNMPANRPDAHRTANAAPGSQASSVVVRFELDYLLVNCEPLDQLSIDTSHSLNDIQDTIYGTQERANVRISEAVAIGDSANKVLAVTGSWGPVPGILLPGIASLLRPGSLSFQKLYTLYLDMTLDVGDCGSAVIDATTGSLYGHIVISTPGTPTAYIISALEVLQDIKLRGFADVSLDLRKARETKDCLPSERDHPLSSNNTNETWPTGGVYLDVFEPNPDIWDDDGPLEMFASAKPQSLRPSVGVTSTQTKKGASHRVNKTTPKSNSQASVKGSSRQARRAGQHVLSFSQERSDFYCGTCETSFRGSHELRRHNKSKHSKSVAKTWVCQDPRLIGVQTVHEPIKPLSDCESCSNQKEYSMDYNAAAHLRRIHFRQPATAKEEPHPPMRDLKYSWICQVTDPSEEIIEDIDEESRDELPGSSGSTSVMIHGRKPLDFSHSAGVAVQDRTPAANLAADEPSALPYELPCEFGQLDLEEFENEKTEHFSSTFEQLRHKYQSDDYEFDRQ